MSNQIVVLGQDYSAMVCMINSLKEYDVFAIKRTNKENKIKKCIKRIIIGKNIESLPQNVKKIEYVTPSMSDEKIINIIKKEYRNFKKGKIIIIPTSDFMASLIDKNKEELDERFIVPTIKGKNNEIIQLMDKGTQKQIAQKCGLNIITEYDIKKEKKEYIIPPNIEFPVFIKPKISFLGEKSIMRKCNNIQELKKELKEIGNNYNCPILIEKFVNIEKEYAILGCSYKNEITIPGIIEKIDVAKGKNKGVTLKGKTVPAEKYINIIEKIEKFIKSLKFDGLFDIELYEENGKMYFNELNLRFGAEGYGITGSGVNLPRIYVKKVTNSNTKCNKKLKERIFLSDKANLESYESNAISWKEYVSNQKNIDFSFIKTENKKLRFSFKRLELYAKIKKIFKSK